MHLTFFSIADTNGEEWKALFRKLWPVYRAWYLREGDAQRPTFLECHRALKAHMPEIVPVWERLVDMAGGGDVEARFLSLYGPPAYLVGCSQAVWSGEEPLLVRNYDYSPGAFDAVVLQTHWTNRRVVGTSDCLIGLVDGINDAGLAVSLTFGGRRVVGAGFGVPIVLRYILETCETAEEAGAVLARIPVHMAYNVTALDRQRRRVTAYLGPGRETLLTNAAVATNHQERVEWQHYALTTATAEREHFLLQRLALHEESADKFIRAFLRPPLYSLAFDRGFGTLYTAALWPRRREIELHWPGASWTISLDVPVTSSRVLTYPAAN